MHRLCREKGRTPEFSWFLKLFCSGAGEGLRATVSTFLNGTKIRKVDYCAYVKLRRGITPNGENSFSAGEFGDVSHHGYLLKDGDA